MQGRTQLAQRAMSAHDMAVEMASHKELTTLESGSNSQSWQAASEPPLKLCKLFQSHNCNCLQCVLWLCDTCTTALQHQEDQMHLCTLCAKAKNILACRSPFPEESRCNSWSRIH